MPSSKLAKWLLGVMTPCSVHLLVLLSLTKLSFQTLSTAEYYVGAVVNYLPSWSSEASPENNVMNNAAAYAVFMRQASLQMADVVVFPEMGLRGGNPVFPIVLPHPKAKVNPCDKPRDWSSVLVFLSCAASDWGIYAVVNVDEKLPKLNSTVSTHIVFDKDGTLAARYRVGSGEDSYFDTQMGVRIGLISDVDLLLANHPRRLMEKFNVSHFTAPIAVTNRLPFLTALQMQWSSSWLDDVGLLGAGLVGRDGSSTGSGLYSGKRGALEYTSGESPESIILLQAIPKTPAAKSPHISVYWDRPLTQSGEMSRLTRDVKVSQESHSTARTVRRAKENTGSWRETLNGYVTQLVQTKGPVYPMGHTLYTRSIFLESAICQNLLCCRFKLNMSNTFVKEKNYRWVKNSRADDFTRGLYRMVAFGGVQSLAAGLTAKVHRCALVPCLDSSLESCGLRPDQVLSYRPEPVTDPSHGTLIQVATSFHSLTITANFLGSPNALVSGKGRNFGAPLRNSEFIYDSGYNGSSITVTLPLHSLITIGLQDLQSTNEMAKLSHDQTWTRST